MSDDFQRFLDSNFFNDPFWAIHDGVEVSTLTRLQGEDLTKAEAMLLERLPDNRAIVGLGAIRSQKAVEPLRKLLTNKAVATDVATALKQITGESSGLDHLVESLKNRHDLNRMWSAIALREFHSEKAVEALLYALDDPHDLVRYHAANSLLILYGIIEERDRLSPPKLSISMMRDSERAAAADEIRRIVREGTLKEE